MKFKGTISVAGDIRETFEVETESDTNNEAVVAYLAQAKVEEIVQRLMKTEQIDPNSIHVELDESNNSGCVGCKGCNCGGM